MGIIYKAENSINGKSYIGQTSCSLEKRADEHRRDALRGCDFKFHRAIRKYGFESFVFDVLEVAPDAELNEREQYWIEFFDTYKNGYNSTRGGHGYLKLNKAKIREMWDKGFSTSEIAMKLNCTTCAVGQCLKGYTTYSTKESIYRGKRNQMRKVAQYDMSGKLIQHFDSIADAAKCYDVDRTLISACCRKKRWSGVGYQWRYADDDPPQSYEVEQKCAMSVLQIDAAGMVVSKYRSLLEASRETGINRRKIIRCCSLAGSTAGGYGWSCSA